MTQKATILLLVKRWNLVDDDDDVEPAHDRTGKGRGKDIEWLGVARYTEFS